MRTPGAEKANATQRMIARTPKTAQAALSSSDLACPSDAGGSLLRPYCGGVPGWTENFSRHSQHISAAAGMVAPQCGQRFSAEGSGFSENCSELIVYLRVRARSFWRNGRQDYVPGESPVQSRLRSAPTTAGR